MQLAKYKPVPSGMSFDLDTGPDPLAYVLATPGNTVVVGLAGSGVWTVEILTSTDGLNYTLLDTHTVPGQWRYPTKTAQAIAMRVSSYTSGPVGGMLAHGGLLPVTNVMPLFDVFLVFSYNATPTAPPIGNQIRFNSANLSAVTKVWISNTTVDGTDQWQAIRKIPHGGTLLVQDRDNHTHAVLFSLLGLPVDKVDYVELPVAYQQHLGALAQAQVLVCVFNPGPVLTLSPIVATQLPAPDPPVRPPVLSALDPFAAALGSPSFTLRVLGATFLPGDVILWNGSPEPTTVVSPTELTTGVNMDTAQVALPIPVAVETADGQTSNALTFNLGGEVW